jgi:hypothetical protein
MVTDEDREAAKALLQMATNRTDQVWVYAITSGEYSDYGVDCLFTTRALAEAYLVSRYGNASAEGARVETFQLWSAVPTAADVNAAWQEEAKLNG